VWRPYGNDLVVTVDVFMRRIEDRPGVWEAAEPKVRSDSHRDNGDCV
jgi:hypothetical protein